MGAGGIVAGLGRIVADAFVRARPHDFDCGALLAGCIEEYAGDPWTRAIHRDARGHRRGSATFSEMAAPGAPAGAFSQALADALAPPAAFASTLEKEGPALSRLLLLSGGGQWGAFGAGFLEAWGPKTAPTPYHVVTGISTGAIQGLFVANSDWAGLARAYTIDAQSDLALAKGPLGLLSIGAQFDTAPLRDKIRAYLTADGFARLKGLAGGAGPHLLIGIVRARDGALLVVDIGKAAAQLYAGGPPPTDAAQSALAECVTGVVLASAAVPAQLRPVRLALAGEAPASYVDGGVRSSVFAALVGDTARALGSQAGRKVEVAIDVIRNGPTVVFAETDPAGGAPPVDRKPTVLEIGKRSYATIVNQVEVASIALLRLLFPAGAIKVMTADGFDTPGDNPAPRARPPEDHVFDPDFMRALIAWGGHRARRPLGPDWIELAAVGDDATAPAGEG